MLRARDRHSMHRLLWLDECVRMHDFLRLNISGTVGGQSIQLLGHLRPELRDEHGHQLFTGRFGFPIGPRESRRTAQPVAELVLLNRTGQRLRAALGAQFLRVRTRKSADTERGAEKDSPEVAELDAITDI
ncbi:hypothetical protein niasHT_001195 [Heterodera trifolii]